jgi:hypothetical protein
MKNKKKNLQHPRRKNMKRVCSLIDSRGSSPVTESFSTREVHRHQPTKSRGEERKGPRDRREKRESK